MKTKFTLELVAADWKWLISSSWSSHNNVDWLIIRQSYQIIQPALGFNSTD